MVTAWPSVVYSVFAPGTRSATDGAVLYVPQRMAIKLGTNKEGWEARHHQNRKPGFGQSLSLLGQTCHGRLLVAGRL